MEGQIVVEGSGRWLTRHVGHLDVDGAEALGDGAAQAVDCYLRHGVGWVGDRGIMQGTKRKRSRFVVEAISNAQLLS